MATENATAGAAGGGGLCPYIAVSDANAAISFYRSAFGALELFRLVDPVSGKIGHAELALGASVLMLSDEYPDFGAVSPDTLGGAACKLHLDVEDATSVVEAALSAGGTLLRKLELQFHGCRQAMVADPFGYIWFISEKVEDVSPPEMQNRWNQIGNC